MGAMKELLFDLADLQDAGVDIHDYQAVTQKAEGRLAEYVANIGSEKWSAVAVAIAPAAGLVTDEDGCMTQVVKLITELRSASQTMMKVGETMASSNPHITNALTQILVETAFTITFLEGIVKAKDSL